MPLSRADIQDVYAQHLEAGGDSDLAKDFSGAEPTFAKLRPADRLEFPQHDFLVTHIAVVYSDNGGFDAGAFGNNITLTNGIQLHILDDSGAVIRDLMEGHTVHTNGEWATHAESINLTDFGAGDNYLAVHFEFLGQWGAPITIRNGNAIAMSLQDDFSGLNTFEAYVAGVYV